MNGVRKDARTDVKIAKTTPKATPASPDRLKGWASSPGPASPCKLFRPPCRSKVQRRTGPRSTPNTVRAPSSSASSANSRASNKTARAGSANPLTNHLGSAHCANRR